MTTKRHGKVQAEQAPAQAASGPPPVLGGAVPGFPIVGIGASAGGLAALEAFFSGMPADTDPGMAFVIVQHLAPDHKSILTELIRRYTRMQVFEVHDGQVTTRGQQYYLLTINQREGMLYFKASSALSRAQDKFNAIPENADNRIIAAVHTAARQCSITVRQVT